MRDQLAVQLAARDAARAAAVAADPGGAATTAADGAVALRPLEVTTSMGSATVTATVRFVEHTDVPLIGALLPDLTLSATASMQLEPP